jgi:hypothetical protein
MGIVVPGRKTFHTRQTRSAGILPASGRLRYLGLRSRRSLSRPREGVKIERKLVWRGLGKRPDFDFRTMNL